METAAAAATELSEEEGTTEEPEGVMMIPNDTNGVWGFLVLACVS